ncbi:MAG: DUF1028 domain-containing protein [Gemmatimonadota bacterium]
MTRERTVDTGVKTVKLARTRRRRGTLARPAGLSIILLGAAGAPAPPAAGQQPSPVGAEPPPVSVEAPARGLGRAGFPTHPFPRRPVSTYSIVARDPATGQLGVAVQSHWFSVGSVVPWAASGVGAIATQSFVEPAYGFLGLEMLRRGKNAEQTLAGLLAADPHPEVRQVGVVDAAGNVAVHTGDQAIAEACQRRGPGFTVEANLMLNPTVCDAMFGAYTQASGDLAERLMAALHAAQGEGGDIRGRQAAAILVVRGEPTGRPWEDRIFDLRVEDDSNPLAELDRLLVVARAYRHMNAGDELVTQGEIDRALEEYGRAEQLLPDRSEPVFWHAVTLASVGRAEESLPLFAKAFGMREEWRTLVPRLVPAGLLPDDKSLIARILAR